MRVFKALIISLFIYSLFISTFIHYVTTLKPVPKKLSNHVIKIDIKEIPLPVATKVAAPIEKKPPLKPKLVIKKKPKIKKKKKVVQKAKKKHVSKKIKKKKVIKKKLVKKVKKKIAKKKKKVHVPKKIKKKKVVKKKSKELEAFENDMVYIPESMLKPKSSSKNQKAHADDLGSFLSTPPSTISPPWSYPNDKIRKLYGATFHDFTPTQKKFIENNLNTIQEITQRVLTQRGYPEGAAHTGQQGTNVVSFNLHPNGDISDLRLKRRIGYRALDDNTLSLIRVAYMDYPYPSTTTKIIFYVTYSIYGY